MRSFRWKPQRGWREFLDEIVIVVVGVLIALAAQQFVQSLDWRQKVLDATASLREEIADHYVLAAEQVMAGQCIDQQLKDLEARILASGDRLNPAPSFVDAQTGEYTFRAPSRPWPEPIWQSTVSEGVSSHIDKMLRSEITYHYSLVDLMRDNKNGTDNVAWRLRSLARPLPLDPGTRSELVQLIEEERGRFGYSRLVAQAIIDHVGQMKMVPPRSYVDEELAPSATLSFCRAHGYSLTRVK